MKKLFLYVFFILMYCNVAHAIFLESLVSGFIATIIIVIAWSITNSFIPVYIMYGIGIIWTLFFFFSVLSKLNKKERKQALDNNIPDFIGMWIFPILFLAALLFFPVPNLFSLKMQGANTAATKAFHDYTITYISTELMICKLGESKFMKSNQYCPATVHKTIKGAVATMIDKNPFDREKLAVRRSNSNKNDEDLGYISLSASGSEIIYIKSCIKTPCRKEENRLFDWIVLNND